MIVRQHTCDAAFAHRVHRNAVGETVSFVESACVEIDSGKKGLAGLLYNLDILTFENPLNYARGELTHSRIVTAKVVEHFDEHGFGGDESCAAERRLNC